MLCPEGEKAGPAGAFVDGRELQERLSLVAAAANAITELVDRFGAFSCSNGPEKGAIQSIMPSLRSGRADSHRMQRK